MPPKRVAIVGAGASGLPSIRHALLYGLDVTCFESSNEVGGLWRFKPQETDESSVMKSTVINTSKEMTAYSDFPPLPDMPNFMHNREMLRYLKLYADKFNMRKYIKFGHKVIQVERSADYGKTGKWKVIYQTPSGEQKEEIFDAVMMASGHHTIPYFPKKWEGQDNFKGKIIHSHSYKDHRGFEDQVVVVVGVGNSGGDIAVELSRIAKQVSAATVNRAVGSLWPLMPAHVRSLFFHKSINVYLVTRRGTWVFNRVYDYGIPFDIALNRRILFQMKDFVPQILSNMVVEAKLNKRFDHARFGLKPAHHVFSAHPTVNDELPTRISSGTVKIKPNIRKFTENGVEFMDGTVVGDVDTVFLSTGFSFEFNLVEKGKLIPVVENEVDLYQYMYPMETADHNTLAIIGLVQPFGSIMPASEMQARVFFENLVGTHPLPSRAQMRENITKKRTDMANRYVKSRRHTIQIDYVDYMDEMAGLIGARPDIIELLKKDPMLAWKVEFGPCVPYVYRLQGPHAWEGAKQAISTVDERVYKATNSGPYQSNCFCLYTAATIAVLILLVFFML